MKEAFEKWYLEQQDPEAYLASNDSGYFDDTVQMVWGVWSQAWTASRSAIEIELDGDACHSDEYFCDGYRIATETAEEAITSHGIRIKGKTE